MLKMQQLVLQEVDGRVDLNNVYFSYTPDKKAYRGLYIFM